MEDEKGLKFIVYTIIVVILVTLGIAVFLLYKKFHNDNHIPETTTKTQITKVICSIWNNTDYNRYKELTLEYNYGEIYKLDVLYQYEYKYSFNKEKVRTELQAIYRKEVNESKEGISGEYKSNKTGGSTSLSYDLLNDEVRRYVNSEYFHNNIYLKQNDLIQYMTDNGFTCKQE